MQLPLAVFPKPAAMIEPSEGALDDPAFWHDLKGMQLVSFDHFDLGADEPSHIFGEIVACEALSRKFFSRVVALFLRCEGILHASGVDDDHRGLLITSVFHALRLDKLAQNLIQQGFSVFSRRLPNPKMVVNILPFRKIVRQRPPPTALFEHVLHRAKNVVQLVLTRMRFLLRGGQVRLYHRELLSRDVTWICFSHFPIVSLFLSFGKMLNRLLDAPFRSQNYRLR